MKASQLLLRAALFAFALCYLSVLVLRFHCITIYQARDIHRAMNLLHGQWIWHGSDLMGGGTTPGPFYYWLLAIPLGLFGGSEPIVWLELVLAATAAVGLWELGTRRHSPMAGWLAFFLFLHSGIIKMSLTDFWSASFVFVFQVMALLLLLEPKNRGRLAAGAFLLGLSVQIHYTLLIFLAGALVSIKKAKPRLIVLSAFALPLLPYLFWALFFSPARAVGHSTAEGARTLLKPLSHFSGWQPSEQLGKFIFDATLFDSRYPLLFGILGGALLALAISRKRIPLPKDRLLWATLAVSALPIPLIAYESSFLRYAVPFVLLTFFFTACIGAELASRFPRAFLVSTVLSALGWICFREGAVWIRDPSLIARWQSIALVLLAGTFAAFWLRGISGATVSVLLAVTVTSTASSHTFRLNYDYPDYAWDLPERSRLATALVDSTGWNYDRLRERTYLLGIEPEEDLSILYEEAFRRHSLNSHQTLSMSEADGVLAVHANWGGFLDRAGSRPDWSRLRDRVPEEIYVAAVSGELECAKTEWAGDFQICYYRFKSGASRSWNNLGHPYRRREPAPVASDEKVLQVNACKNLESACTLSFRIRMTGPGVIEVQAFGDPIGAPDSAVNPAWSASIRNASLEVKCGSAWTKHRLASLLGAPARGEKRDPYFLAPYRNQFPAGCRKPAVVAISASTGSSSFNAVPAGSLAPFRLEWTPN